MSASTAGLDAKLRKAAADRLKNDAAAALKNFLTSLDALHFSHKGSIKVDVSEIARITDGNPQFNQRNLTAKAGMLDLLQAAVSAWVSENKAGVEEKAVAEFIERVDRLASEVDEIREYAQDAQR